MHLNKLLEQIKRHQSPTEAIDKLATALEKHEGSLLEKGFTILKSELAANMYEAINGPHFDNVVLGICPKVWCRLPKEGVIVLEVRHTAEASGASLPVFISVSGSVSTASNTHNIPLVNASSAPITGSQVSAGNRYIAYFNKCDNVIQLMSYTPAAPTPAA
jgi:hypothetical protein